MSKRPRKTNPVINVEIPNQEYFTFQEVADLAGCTKGNLSAMYFRGNFIEIDLRKGRKFLYKRENVVRWLSQYRPNNDPKRIGYKSYRQMNLLEESKE